MKLVIGNKNYSTWSMRPWVFLRGFDVNFEEQWVSLQEPDLHQRLKQFSDSAKVPVLQDGDLTLWDSLAICEYVNDQYLDGAGWPSDPSSKGFARSVAAEMHSSFAALRNEMPMNIRASRIIQPSQQCLRDIQRIDEIWSRFAAPDSDGNLRLFGQFSIADCMFAPVVMRFATYQPILSKPAQAYANAMLTQLAIAEWINGALQESEIVDVDEAGTERN